jgi:uncharacterized protein (DUF2141 family)
MMLYLCLFLFSNLNNPTFDLKIEFNGMSSKKGTLQVAIYRKQDSFPEKKGAYKGKIQEASNNLVIFENLPKDTYAVAVYHDENGNGKIDKNIVGMPTEKYGFSNNARGTFSAPSFQEASVEVNTDRKIVILLK